MKTVVLYQLPAGHREIYKEYNKKNFNMRNYEIVYECERPNDYTPDDAFDEFNRKKPVDYTGRSLSISDVIGIGNTMYYCNSTSWKILKPHEYE